MYILFDIGGTKMRIGISKDGTAVDAIEKVETPKHFEEGMQVFRELFQKLSGGEKPDAVAGGIAGPFDRKQKVLSKPPNLPGWAQMPIQESIEEITGAQVYIENDTGLVGLGEAHSGAGTGEDIVVYMTVSTGVGGSRIVDGKIDVNRYGFEPGHQVIDVDGSACPSCNVEGFHPDGRGHLEAYISGTAMEKRFTRPPYHVERSDPIWDELARFLAIGLNNTILHWSPDVVVLGGSMIVGDPAISVEKTEKYLRETLLVYPNLPKLKKAELGDNGGIEGARIYLNQKLGKSR